MAARAVSGRSADRGVRVVSEKSEIFAGLEVSRGGVGVRARGDVVAVFEDGHVSEDSDDDVSRGGTENAEGAGSLSWVVSEGRRACWVKRAAVLSRRRG